MNTFIRVEEWLAKGFLAAASLLVFVAALARALGAPLIWAIDIAQLLFIWCCFLGADQALRAKQHIVIDVVVRWLPTALQRALVLFHWLVMIVFLALLVGYGTQLTLLNVQRPMGDTDISYAYVTAAVPVGCLLLLVTAARQLREFWRSDRASIGTADSAL